MQKNVAGQKLTFHAVSSSDGSDVTSGSPTVYFALDGGAPSSASGSIVHNGNGDWLFSPTQSETNGDHAVYTFTMTGVVTQTVNVYPVSFDPTDAADLGVTALTGHTPQSGDTYSLANGASGFATIDGKVSDVLDDTGTSGVLLSSGTGSGQLNFTNGIVDANIEQIDSSTLSATNLALSTGVIVPGAAIAGTLSTTEMTTDLTETTDDHYNGCLLVFTSGNLTGQRLSVTDYDGTSKKLTFSAATEAPTATDAFILV